MNVSYNSLLPRLVIVFRISKGPRTYFTSDDADLGVKRKSPGVSPGDSLDYDF